MWTQWLERTLRKRPKEMAVAPERPAADCHCEQPEAARQSPQDCVAQLAVAADERAEEI